MSREDACPDCGAPLPADAPRGLCPHCLMGAALSRATVEGPGSDAEVTVSFEPVGSRRGRDAGRPGRDAGRLPRVLLRDTEARPALDPVVQPASPEMPGPADRRPAPALRRDRPRRHGRRPQGPRRRPRPRPGRQGPPGAAPRQPRAGPPVRRGGPDRRPAPAPRASCRSTSWARFADRRPYFAMKLVKGRTLAALLAERERPGRRTCRGFLAIFEQVCQTMAYAHARGVIHRDLKPSNVMVGSFGEVQVMDWGLAKVLPRGGVADDGAGRAGGRRRDGHPHGPQRLGRRRCRGPARVLGTPAYMAPEQARGEVDAARRAGRRLRAWARSSARSSPASRRSPAATAGEIQRKAARGRPGRRPGPARRLRGRRRAGRPGRGTAWPAEPEDRPARRRRPWPSG